MPKSLPLADWGTVTEVSENAGFLGATAISDATIVELYPDIVRTLTEAGYSLLGGDNEGFEAEITLANRKGRLTTLTLQMGECDEVIIRVLVESKREGGG